MAGSSKLVVSGIGDATIMFGVQIHQKCEVIGLFASAIFKEAKKPITNLINGITFLQTHKVVIGAEGEHADLLYLHEAGVPSRNIPPRPVLEPALRQWKVKMQMRSCMRRAMYNAIIKGDLGSAEDELEKMGIAGVNACKKYITDGTHLAPNSPVTIARKGSSIPLIDTGALLNSITYRIGK